MHKAVDGSSYVGHYSKGQRNGHGAYLFGNGDRYVIAPIHCAPAAGAWGLWQ